MKKRNISTTGDTAIGDIEIKEPVSYAAGLLGVKVALEHTFREMGVTRSMKALNYMNKKDGFDCPGCAWPDPEKRSKLGEYCENGAKALSEEATSDLLEEEFFRKYSVEEMSGWTDYRIGKSGRLTRPLILRPGSSHYEPIDWDEAYKVIAENLSSLQDPDEAIFYTSGRSSNEAAFIYGLFSRAFGTNNMPDCSNMCHESSGVALKDTVGIGKGSVTLEDFPDAEVVMIMGQNPGTNHPRMLSALEKCKKNGGSIITVNPLQEAGLIRFKDPQTIHGTIGSGVSLTDAYLQVKINQDVALLKLIIKKLAALDGEDGKVFDHRFIQDQTEGYDALLKDLAKYNETQLLAQCGVPEKDVDEAVRLLAEKDRIIICWAMGLTQHKNGVDNIKECVNLLLLKGSIGKPGAGTCPVRGHSNVQGDRTVGIMHYVSEKLNRKIKEVFGFTPPDEEGVDTVKAMEAMHEGRAKIFMSLGGNFVSAASDTNYTAEALQNCQLTVSVSTKLNRTHMITGETSVILPTLGRSEQDIRNGKKHYLTVENSMGRVHRSAGILPPCSEEVRSEPVIIGELANAYFSMNPDREGAGVDWITLGSDYEVLRSYISRVVDGFEAYSKRSEGHGFFLPNNARAGDFSSLPNGKAVLSICKPAEHETAEDELILMTIRSHDQFNTTIYGLNDRYRGVYNGRRVVFINKNDLSRLGFSEGQRVDLISFYDGVERRAENFLLVTYNIPEGNLAAYFPETNVLVPYNHYADRSNTPISKSVKVKIVSRS